MKIDDKRLGLFVLLTKLDILGVCKVSYSMYSIATAKIPIPEPYLEMAIVSLSLDIMRFTPKRLHRGEDIEWFKI